MENLFDLDYQYQLLLNKMGIKENVLHPEQKKQLKQMFMAASGHMLLLLRDEATKLSTLDHCEAMASMLRQVKTFSFVCLPN